MNKSDGASSLHREHCDEQKQRDKKRTEVRTNAQACHQAKLADKPSRDRARVPASILVAVPLIKADTRVSHSGATYLSGARRSRTLAQGMQVCTVGHLWGRMPAFITAQHALHRHLLQPSSSVEALRQVLSCAEASHGHRGASRQLPTVAT